MRRERPSLGRRPSARRGGGVHQGGRHHQGQQAGGEPRGEPVRHPRLGKPLPRDPGRRPGPLSGQGTRERVRHRSRRPGHGDDPLRQPGVRPPDLLGLPAQLRIRDEEVRHRGQGQGPGLPPVQLEGGSGLLLRHGLRSQLRLRQQADNSEQSPRGFLHGLPQGGGRPGPAPHLRRVPQRRQGGDPLLRRHKGEGPRPQKGGHQKLRPRPP